MTTKTAFALPHITVSLLEWCDSNITRRMDDKSGATWVSTYRDGTATAHPYGSRNSYLFPSKDAAIAFLRDEYNVTIEER